MRALILLLPLSVALAAGGSPLDDAARRWASDSVDEREAASRAVARHLERELAPLVEAMRSEDPEVRLRAEGALEAFLPRRPREEAPPADPDGGQMIVVGQGAGGGQIRLVVAANGQIVVQQQADDPLKAHGLEGKPVDDELLRVHLGLAAGRGFGVTAVEGDSAAAKLGLKRHDILFSIDGRPVMRADEVSQALKLHPAEVKVLRRGEVLALGRGPVPKDR